MNKKPLEDLAHIKSMMSQSTKFLSLSGWSGIMAGIYALIGAAIAHYIIKDHNQNKPDYSYFTREADPIFTGKLIGIALLVMTITIVTGFALSYRKSVKAHQKFWTSATKRAAIQGIIPLSCGGAFCIALYYYQCFGLIAPAMLIFYGISLVNSAKYTHNEFHYLGIMEIILGFISLFFIGKGLLFWTIGFGFLHIIYGILMEIKKT